MTSKNHFSKSSEGKPSFMTGNLEGPKTFSETLAAQSKEPKRFLAGNPEGPKTFSEALAAQSKSSE